MRKRTIRILDNLYDALATYKAAYKDKTAQLSDAEGKIKILESEKAELNHLRAHNLDKQRTIEAINTENAWLTDQLDQRNVDFEASQDELASIKTTLDAVCERNRWYSDLIYAMTGNRDHETVKPSTFRVEHSVSDNGLKTAARIAVEAIPGQDCAPKPFCKSFISETCIGGGTQCPEGVCRRAQATQAPNSTMDGYCKDCARKIGNGPGECYGNCDLPF